MQLKVIERLLYTQYAAWSLWQSYEVGMHLPHITEEETEAQREVQLDGKTGIWIRISRAVLLRHVTPSISNSIMWECITKKKEKERKKEKRKERKSRGFPLYKVKKTGHYHQGNKYHTYLFCLSVIQPKCIQSLQWAEKIIRIVFPGLGTNFFMALCHSDFCSIKG